MKRIQQEVRLRSKAKGSESLHYKREGLQPRSTWRAGLRVGDEEVEIREQTFPCGSGEA